MTDHRTLEAKILAMYLGQKCTYSLGIEWTIMGVYENDMCEVGIRGQSTTTDIANIKPILRKLESISKEEAHYLGWLNMQHPRDNETQPDMDEVDVNIVLGDGGNMVDGDVAAIIEIECRCFIGQLVIRLNGDLEMWDTEADQRIELAHQTKQFLYLLSRGFDLFDLIPRGLAIEKGEGE